jgi:hypothetical protein
MIDLSMTERTRMPTNQQPGAGSEEAAEQARVLLIVTLVLLALLVVVLTVQGDLRSQLTVEQWQAIIFRK